MRFLSRTARQVLINNSNHSNHSMHSLQEKMRMGTKGDVYEQQADHIAEQVVQTKGDKEEKPQLKAQEDKVQPKNNNDEDKDTVQSKSRDDAEKGAFKEELAAAGSGGEQLDPVVLAEMQQRFRTGFTHVRIHTDAQAAKLCTALHARAFTNGSHIYFSEGEYDPRSRSGKQLIAHELVHVLQQRAQLMRKAGEADLLPEWMPPAKQPAVWLSQVLLKDDEEDYSLFTHYPPY